MFESPEQLPRHIHFCGIGGAGMSALALALHERGFRVTGSDREETAVTRELREKGIELALVQQAVPQSPPPGLVIRTAAMPLDHPEIRDALSRGLPLLKRSELLGLLGRRPHSIAVAGTHGKTTVSAMLAHTLHAAGADPGWFVGAQLQGLPAGHLGGSDLLVLEADEYDRSFLTLHPGHLLVTRLDWDHVDIYPRPEDLYEAMQELADRLPEGRILQQAHADPESLPWRPGAGSACVGRAASCDWILAGDGEACRLRHRDTPDLDWAFRPPMAGEHNRLNAALCLAWCAERHEELGLDMAAVVRGLESFPGLRRRLQTLWSNGRRTLIDDYAHHPSELAALIDSVREMGYRRVTVIHQPHTFSRVEAFAEETARALSAADRVFTWPVFPARERPLPGVDHRSFLPWLGNHPCARAVDDWDGLSRALLPLGESEVVVTAGAGDLYHIHQRLADLLARA